MKLEEFTDKLYSFIDNELQDILPSIEAQRKQLPLIYNVSCIVYYGKLAFIILMTLFFKARFLIYILSGQFSFSKDTFNIKKRIREIEFNLQHIPLIQSFYKDFKYKLVKPFISKVFPFIEYYPESKINQHYFISSYLFDIFGTIDSYQGDDKLSGQYRDVKFEISELHVTNKQNDLFHGLFLVFTLPDAFITTISTANNIAGKNQIQIDNLNFNKLYKAYSPDSIKAFQILTPDLIEGLLRLQSFATDKLKFSFIGKNLYIAIPHDKLFLSPPIKHSLYQEYIYEEYFDEIMTILELIDALHMTDKHVKYKTEEVMPTVINNNESLENNDYAEYVYRTRNNIKIKEQEDLIAFTESKKAELNKSRKTTMTLSDILLEEAKDMTFRRHDLF